MPGGGGAGWRAEIRGFSGAWADWRGDGRHCATALGAGLKAAPHGIRECPAARCTTIAHDSALRTNTVQSGVKHPDLGDVRIIRCCFVERGGIAGGLLGIRAQGQGQFHLHVNPAVQIVQVDSADLTRRR